MLSNADTAGFRQHLHDAVQLLARAVAPEQVPDLRPGHSLLARFQLLKDLIGVRVPYSVSEDVARRFFGVLPSRQGAFDVGPANLIRAIRQGVKHSEA